MREIGGGKKGRKAERPKQMICKFMAVAPPLQKKVPYFRRHMMQFRL